MVLPTFARSLARSWQAGAESRSVSGLVPGMEQMFWGPVWSSLHVAVAGGLGLLGLFLPASLSPPFQGCD